MSRWALAAAALLAAHGCAGARAASPALAEGRQLFEQRRYAAAIGKLNGPELQRLRGREQARAYELIGQSQEALRQPDEALRTYQTGVALFPDDLNLLTDLGNLLHRSELDRQARPFYERILAIHPHNAAAHLGLAETEHRLGLLERAAAHYREALQTQGDQGSVWLAYGEVLAEHREPEQALQAIQRSLMLADNVEGRIDEARVLWTLGRRAEAFEALARAGRLAPGRADVVLQRGLWELEAGDLGAARDAAEETLSREPEQPLARWLRAAVELRRGELAEARRDLELAVRGRSSAPFVADAAATVLAELP